MLFFERLPREKVPAPGSVFEAVQPGKPVVVALQAIAVMPGLVNLAEIVNYWQ